MSIHSTSAMRQPTLPATPNHERPGIAPIQRQTIASLALEALRERILRGDYPDGEPLRQDALAEQLGVSRIPVREALRQLEAEGLVTFTPHRGAVVSSLSLEEIEELFELRAEIEGDLLRRATPKTTSEQLTIAARVMDQFEEALCAGDAGCWGTLNWQLHAALYAPAHRTFTLGVLQRLHQHSDRYFRMHVLLAHGGAKAAAEHRAITAAVEKRDASAASRLMRAHILEAGHSLLAFLRNQRGITLAGESRAQ